MSSGEAGGLLVVRSLCFEPRHTAMTAMCCRAVWFSRCLHSWQHSVLTYVLSAVIAAQQVSAGLSAPRIFKQTTVKTNKAPQSFGPLHRAVSRTHNFAFNPALQVPEVNPIAKFVRPDCPPDASEQAAPNGLSQQTSAGSRNAAKQVRNSARSALEQVSWQPLLLLLLFPICC